MGPRRTRSNETSSSRRFGSTVGIEPSNRRLHAPFRPSSPRSFTLGDPRFAWPSPLFWRFVGLSLLGAIFILTWLIALVLLR